MDIGGSANEHNSASDFSIFQGMRLVHRRMLRRSEEERPLEDNGTSHISIPINGLLWLKKAV